MSKSIKIDDDTHKLLKVHAAQTGNSVTEIIRKAVSQFISPNVKVIKGATITRVYLNEGDKIKSGLVKKRNEMNTDDYI